MRCDQCVFYSFGPDEGEGTCHRYPPLQAPDSVQYWPRVRCDDWCGEGKEDRELMALRTHLAELVDETLIDAHIAAYGVDQLHVAVYETSKRIAELESR